MGLSVFIFTAIIVMVIVIVAGPWLLLTRHLEKYPEKYEHWQDADDDGYFNKPSA